ncbi:hypothetical protein K9E64_02445 [Staphylococcus pseudintermedius]|uniref:lantibiotic dehydratase C-terminal domain-containing protein n=1 Tax=Staphylococcus pseudintermedius TaxID=283734 RepID=UPI001915C56C|nr:lantibiotic dehydratase C-terminal domain-containing protein [Staphylococcus pseudintermedius]QQJ71795.1 hypothetical protein JGZ33_02400 [Staphylococcus pseudintermedius]UAS03771.1 hypothetical protein K9E64_02445 [Staphylococcus pseudintermedius]UAS04937.1 hypothetical protein K9E68_09495 [Staphylococcus pseudintermedius]UAS07668.1 hypothetical protein K9E67_02460 [Staphylococcus pseudintermedius]UAS20843.1 hypothetical protein K9E69_02430 [Staphylococcus pseudintermedius]
MNDWMQYNIYVPTIRNIDFLITEFIGEIIKEDYFKDYFFIRYLDDNGPHVRFRYQCTSDKADVSYKLFKKVFEQKTPILKNNKRLSKHLINSKDFKYSNEYYIIPSMYSRELDKYNTNNSISSIEKYFNLNSNSSIYILNNLGDKYKYLEACYNILLLLSSLLNMKKIGSFLNTCADYWIASSRQKAILDKHSISFTKHLSTYIFKKKSSLIIISIMKSNI